mmetsp:Transcript_2736/g.4674  ORF Transcript_2736/g.4674 Transcript_2736/m.4674 type:complete len:106 (+) Transcript_2736:1269-1586(+)
MQEFKAFKVGFKVEGIFGGRLLAVKSKEFITFYDWETQVLVRRIDVTPAPKNVFWNESGQQVILALEENFYFLNFDAEGSSNYIEMKQAEDGEADEDDEGFEEAF